MTVATEGSMVAPRDRAIATQRSASAPQASAWVSASAGTGKTRVLTDRILRLLLEGTRPENVLCLTFTKAAAAEMAGRLARRLSAWAVADDEALSESIAAVTGTLPSAETRTAARKLFAQVLDAPGGVKIQTIHAFCQALLKRFPVEADVEPHFSVMDERDAADLLAEAQRDVLAAAREAGEASDLARALATVTAQVSELGFDGLLRELAGEWGRLTRTFEVHGGHEGVAAAIYGALGLAQGETAEAVLAAATADPAWDREGLRRVAGAMAEGKTSDRSAARLILAWLDGPHPQADRFETYCGAFLTGAGAVRARLVTKDVVASMPDADAILAREADRLVAVRERRAAAETAAASAALMHLAAAMLADYAARKRLRALLDYDDLILKTRTLLREQDMAAWVLFKLDGGIDHILIDEAQDTNPDQWSVIAALADDFFSGLGARGEMPRTVFAVGDVKQSIFSFQRADPDAFAAMRGYFAERVVAAEQDWRPVGLDVSFRSTKAVLDAVDAVFSRPDAADGVSFDGEAIRHEADRAALSGRVELWPPVSPPPQDAPDPWTPPTESVAEASPRARLAERIADTVAGWVGGGALLESEQRPIRPQDVLVLVRRRSGFVDELVRLLKQRDVPVAGVDRMKLGEQLSVMDLIALGRFLLLPQDDLTLASVLKGPLVGLDEDALFAAAFDRGGRSLWQALRERAGQDPALAAAHGRLAGLLARADFVPPYTLYADILEREGGRKAILGRLGTEAEDPVDEFLALALAYERAHTPSLEGFLHWVEAGETEVKRDLEQGERDEVRVMTVHGSKGLEAPIVFLADTMSVPQGRSPAVLWGDPADDPVPLWAPRAALEVRAAAERRAEVEDRRAQEYRRLLYVAMTRAADRLYVCGWETRRPTPDGCWYRLIERGLGPIAKTVPVDFGERWRGDGLRYETGAPGQPRAVAALLPGLERETPPAWAFEPPPAEPTPPRPFAPSRPDGEEPPVRSPLGTDDGERFRRGLVIHRLLQSLPDVPDGDREAAGRRYLARGTHGLDAETAAAALDETLAVIAAPEHRALFGANSLAEVPITGVVGGRVVSGQVDRLVVTSDDIKIVDFKTNRPPPVEVGDVPEIYVRQMAAYRAVLQRIYADRAVRCLLLWTDGPRLMALPDALLDGALGVEAP